MRHTLICTVGTSLKSHVVQKQISRDLSQRYWDQIARALLSKSPSDHACGAEINSINSILMKKGLASRIHLFLLVSDTEDGRNIGGILKSYFEHKDCPMRFEQVTSHVVEGLRDDNVHDFRTKGLKNLVRLISQIVRERSSDAVAINATGGYKAQISFAGMIGQALEVPVYYMFEKFSEVITLPPQPVSLNLGLWLENYMLFERLEEHEPLPDHELKTYAPPEAVVALLDDIQVDAEKYWELTAIGQLFHERSRHYFLKHDKTLSSCEQDDTPPGKKPIKLSGTHHGNDELLNFAKSLVRSRYVSGIVNSIDFDPKRTKPIRNVYHDGRIDFTLTWTDAGFGLCVQTTGRNKSEAQAIALHLEKEFFSS